MRVLFGIGFGMTSTSFPTMASDVIPIKRLGEGMGYFGLSTTLAMSIGPMIGLTLLQDGVHTACDHHRHNQCTYLPACLRLDVKISKTKYGAPRAVQPRVEEQPKGSFNKS